MRKPSELPYLFAMDTPLPISGDEGLVRIKGWCFLTDGNANIHVRLSAAGVTVNATDFTDRPDVSGAFPDHPQAAASGFEIKGFFPPGVHTARLEAGTDALGWTLLREFSIACHLAPLFAAIDLPVQTVITSNTSVEGWCVHPQFEIDRLYLHYGNIIVRLPHTGLERADLARSQPHLPHALHSGFVSGRILRHGSGSIRIRAITKCGKTFFATTRHSVEPGTESGWTPSDPTTGEQSDFTPSVFNRLRRVRSALPSIAFLCDTREAEDKAVSATIDSLKEQHCENWTFVRITRSGAKQGAPTPDSRVVDAPVSAKIPETDALLAAAKDTAADFVCILRAGDRIADGALATLTLAVLADPRTDVWSTVCSIEPKKGPAEMVVPAPWSRTALAAGTARADLPWIARTSFFKSLEIDSKISGQAYDLEMLLRIAEQGVRFNSLSLHFATRVSSDTSAPPPAAAVERHVGRTGIKATVATAQWPDRLVLVPAEKCQPRTVSAIILPGRNPAALASTLESLKQAHDGALLETIILVDEPLDPVAAAAASRLSATTSNPEKGERLPAWLNRAAASATGEWILFCAPGVTFVSAYPLDHLRLFAAQPHVAIATPLLLRADGSPTTPADWLAAGAAPEVMACESKWSDAADRAAILVTREVPAAPVAVWFASRERFQSSGAFHSEFRANLFDLDYCAQQRGANHAVVLCAEARATWAPVDAGRAGGFDTALFLDRNAPREDAEVGR